MNTTEVKSGRRVLCVGGSGSVGLMVLPYLAQHHDVTVFDLNAPPDGPWRYLPGDATSFDEVKSAAEGTDTVVFLAMGPVRDWGDPDNVAAHLKVAAVGVNQTLWAASEVGVTHAVFISSMSVYADRGESPFPAEAVDTDATDFYGLAKRVGEQVAEAAVHELGISVVALRLCLPTRGEDWPRQGLAHLQRIATSARDVARAILAAIEHRDCGFDAVTISGDVDQVIMPIEKARRVLGWAPLDATSTTAEN